MEGSFFRAAAPFSGRRSFFGSRPFCGRRFSRSRRIWERRPFSKRRRRRRLLARLRSSVWRAQGSLDSKTGGLQALFRSRFSLCRGGRIRPALPFPVGEGGHGGATRPLPAISCVGMAGVDGYAKLTDRNILRPTLPR
jgi:hypothetical protein